MTATDELRRLLDEHGVEHFGDGYQHITTYRMADALASVTETSTGKLMLRATFETPEQAIAATLGAGTCRLKRAQWDDGTCTWGCICTACDAHLEHETGIGYSYCPHCGRKVVTE